MACFLVAAAEAVGVTVAVQVLKHKDKKRKLASSGDNGSEKEEKLPFYKKLQWLANLLWGGVILLAFEHLWHGEVVPWFPFLTAASDPTSLAEMFSEMATVGVAMCALVTFVWAVVVIVYSSMEKRRIDAVQTAKE